MTRAPAGDVAMPAMRRLAIALAVVAIWAVITVWGGYFQAGRGSLSTLVTERVVLATPIAAAFLLLVGRVLRWNDLGLEGPHPRASVWLLWPLGVYVAGFLSVAVLTQDLDPRIVAIVAINTAFVGFSEELAFRGVLWGAARKAMAFSPGVLLVSGSFGSVHILNAVITGQLAEAGIQAINAFLSGIGYLALRIRMRSLVPIMIGHALWDLAVFLSVSNAAGEAAPVANATQLFAGAALVAPIALYGAWLLRKPEFRVTTDAVPRGPGPES